MSVFDRKGAYHSELVRVTDQEGIVVTFKGQPRQSKDGDSYFVYFECEGSEHYLNIENDDCLEAIRRAPTDVPVMIVAAGRDTSATLRITPLDNGQEYDEMGNPGRPVNGGQQNAPVEQQQQQEPLTDSIAQQRNERVFYECAMAARAVMDRMMNDGRPLNDDERNIAITMYINASR